MILAELATNSAKHAHAGRGLELVVTVEAIPAGVRLAFRDNGPGFPDDVLAGKVRGAGLGLVEGLVSYGLSGRPSLANDGGAVTTLYLPRLDQEGGRQGQAG